MVNCTILLNEVASYANHNGQITSAIRRSRTSRWRGGRFGNYRSNVSDPCPFNHRASAKVCFVMNEPTNFNNGRLCTTRARGKRCNGNGGSGTRSTCPLYRTSPRRGSIKRYFSVIRGNNSNAARSKRHFRRNVNCT